ncbi:hypothetical protein CPB86DRAFT_824786 [Serendipita vermifera]|nr:hypothetical protein CPB86DRAFT_824786 [Serendipita vermifera]
MPKSTKFSVARPPVKPRGSWSSSESSPDSTTPERFESPGCLPTNVQTNGGDMQSSQTSSTPIMSPWVNDHTGPSPRSMPEMSVKDRLGPERYTLYQLIMTSKFVRENQLEPAVDSEEAKTMFRELDIWGVAPGARAQLSLAYERTWIIDRSSVAVKRWDVVFVVLREAMADSFLNRSWWITSQRNTKELNVHMKTVQIGSPEEA